MDTRELIETAMDKTGETSLRGFATRVGVSHTAVVRWLSGERFPKFEEAAQMADLAGLDPLPTAADVRSRTPDGAKYRKLLARLARAAALAGVVLLPSMPSHAGDGVHFVESAHSAYYVKIMRLVAWRLLPWRSLSHGLRQDDRPTAVLA